MLRLRRTAVTDDWTLPNNRPCTPCLRGKTLASGSQELYGHCMKPLECGNFALQSHLPHRHTLYTVQSYSTSALMVADQEATG